MSKNINFEFEQTESLEVVTLPNNWSLSELSLAEYELEQGDLYIKLDGKVFKIANYDDNLTKLIKTTDGETISTEFISEFIVNKEIELVAVSTTNQSIGKVVEVEGIAYAIMSGQKYQLKVGMDLYKGQNIQTLKDSRVEIKMNDQSTIKLAELGKLSLSDFTYDEGSSVGKSIFSIFKGLFAFSSGLIARDDPSNVKVKTPIAEIGLRGTKLAVKVDSDGKSSVTLIDGRIIVSNNDGTVELNTPWQTAYVPSVNALDLKQEKPADFLSKYKSVFSSSTDLKDFLNEDASSNIKDTSKTTQILKSGLNFQQDLFDNTKLEDNYEGSPFITSQLSSNIFAALPNLILNNQITDKGIFDKELVASLIDKIAGLINDLLDSLGGQVTDILDDKNDADDDTEGPIIVEPVDPLLTEDSYMPFFTNPVVYDSDGETAKFYLTVQSQTSSASINVWIKFKLVNSEWQVYGLDIDDQHVDANENNYKNTLLKYFTNLDTSSAEKIVNNLHLDSSKGDADNLGTDFYVASDSSGSNVYGSKADAKFIGDNYQEKDYFLIKSVPTNETATIHMSSKDQAHLRGDAKDIINVYYDAAPQVNTYTPQYPFATEAKLDISQINTPQKLDELNFYFVFKASNLGDSATQLDLSRFLKDQDLSSIKQINFIIEVEGNLSTNQKLDIKISGADENIIDNFNDKIKFTEKVNGGTGIDGFLPAGNHDANFGRVPVSSKLENVGAGQVFHFLQDFY